MRCRQDAQLNTCDLAKRWRAGHISTGNQAINGYLVVGGTVNVKWTATADFLAEPYVGADAYVTKDGLMHAQVSTFDGSKLKFK